MSHHVTLSDFELQLAGMVGVKRQTESMAHNVGYKGVNNRKHGWQYNCDGALGEAALAKYLNVYWDGTPNVFRERPDVANYEVRTKMVGDGPLILRERDKDDAIYILVLGHESPKFTIRGWMYAGYGKRDEFVKSPDPSRPPCWCVPQSYLYDMKDLPR